MILVQQQERAKQHFNWASMAVAGATRNSMSRLGIVKYFKNHLKSRARPSVGTHNKDVARETNISNLFKNILLSNETYFSYQNTIIQKRKHNLSL